MRKSALWLFVLLTLVLRLTLFRKMEIWGMSPDVMVMVVVYVALGFGAVVGAVFGFLVGLAMLAVLSTSVASLPLAATVVGFLVGKYGTKIMYESYIVQILIIFVSVLILDVINFAWSSPDILISSFFRLSLGTALYTSVVGVILVIVIERIIGLRLVA
jgi:rod shape-determining protein MreD